MIDQEALWKHLRKCELQYIADHTDRCESVDWLAPHCNSTQEIAAFLRELGFRIRQIVDEQNSFGECHRWVITTSGILVYVNEDGYTPGLVKRAAPWL